MNIQTGFACCNHPPVWTLKYVFSVMGHKIHSPHSAQTFSENTRIQKFGSSFCLHCAYAQGRTRMCTQVM